MPGPKRVFHPGFSLIELLVVISLIAVLIAILLPILAGARDAAKLTQCLSQQRQLGISIYAYAQDYDGSIPLSQDLPAHPGLIPIQPDLPTNQIFGFDPARPDPGFFTGPGLLLDGYLTVPEALVCPDNSRPDLIVQNIDQVRSQSQDAYTAYIWRNAFAAEGSRIENLGTNPDGEPVSALLFDFNQTNFAAFGLGADSLNHGGRVINLLHIDGRAETESNEFGFYNSPFSIVPDFALAEDQFVALDALGN